MLRDGWIKVRRSGAFSQGDIVAASCVIRVPASWPCCETTPRRSMPPKPGRSAAASWRGSRRSIRVSIPAMSLLTYLTAPQSRGAVVGDERAERIDQAGAFVDARRQQDAAVRAGFTGIERQR
jgi:hypothetical protein